VQTATESYGGVGVEVRYNDNLKEEAS